MIEPELLRAVVQAIGNIQARNTSSIGLTSTLSEELSARMIEKIARTVIEVTNEWLKRQGYSITKEEKS